MTSDDRLFAMARRISAFESQLITRRAFLGGADQVRACGLAKTGLMTSPSLYRKIQPESSANRTAGHGDASTPSRPPA